MVLPKFTKELQGALYIANSQLTTKDVTENRLVT